MKAKLKAKKTLSKFTDRELCSIYEQLNYWEWDNRLGEMPEKQISLIRRCMQVWGKRGEGESWEPTN